MIERANRWNRNIYQDDGLVILSEGTKRSLSFIVQDAYGRDERDESVCLMLCPRTRVPIPKWLTPTPRSAFAKKKTITAASSTSTITLEPCKEAATLAGGRR